MSTEWNLTSPDQQLALSREALRRARTMVGAQAELLAEQMERGTLPSFEGPDALRLLAMILRDESLAPDVGGDVDLPVAQMARRGRGQGRERGQRNVL